MIDKADAVVAAAHGGEAAKRRRRPEPDLADEVQAAFEPLVPTADGVWPTEEARAPPRPAPRRPAPRPPAPPRAAPRRPAPPLDAAANQAARPPPRLLHDSAR